MVYSLYWKTLLKWDDLGENPIIFGNIHILNQLSIREANKKKGSHWFSGRRANMEGD